MDASYPARVSIRMSSRSDGSSLAVFSSQLPSSQTGVVDIPTNEFLFMKEHEEINDECTMVYRALYRGFIMGTLIVAPGQFSASSLSNAWACAHASDHKCIAVPHGETAGQVGVSSDVDLSIL